MRYLGDYAEDATIDFKFHTVDSSDAPITLAGTPSLAVYKANGTTESTAGITLTVDFDSVTGLHHARIDLSADAFYATGNDYQIVIAAGTVDGDSVAGVVLADFSIENRSAISYLGTNLGALGANATEAGGTGDQFTAIDVASVAGSSTAASRLADNIGYLDHSIATVDANVDTLVTSIMSDTDSENLIAVVNALLEGGRLDLLIDAIKAVTDNLPNDGALTTINDNVAGGSGSAMRSEVERLAGVRNWTIYGDDELFGVGTGDNSYVTWPCVVWDSANSKWVCFYVTVDGDGDNQIRRIDSADGKTSWGNRADCIAKGATGTWNADGVWCPRVVIIGGTWYMFATGRTGDYSTTAIGLWTSADGVTWTPSASNPVLSPSLDWEHDSCEVTDVIQVGSTLHLFYTNLTRVAILDEFPSYARKVGRAYAATSDLTSWTKASEPVFGDSDDGYERQPYHGRYSAFVMKNGTNGNYYLGCAVYGPKADYSWLELWECPDIDFDKSTRRRIGVIQVTHDLGTFPDRELDIACFATDDAERDTFTQASGEIRLYFGASHGGTWKVGLMTQADIHEALRMPKPIYDHVMDALPHTRWEKAEESLKAGVSLASTGLDLVTYQGYTIQELLVLATTAAGGDLTIDGTTVTLAMPGVPTVNVSGTVDDDGQRSDTVWSVP